MKVSINKIVPLIHDVLNAGLVPMLTSSPGVGKSDIVNNVIAPTRNLLVIDERLSTSEPTDASGFPRINRETGKSEYVPFETFPLVGDVIPKGYTGWLLFLDELPNANRQTQAAYYKVILDRMVGQRHLHPAVQIICAGNSMSDNACAHGLGTAMQSRLVHLELANSLEAFTEYAIDNGFDGRTIGFVNYRKDVLSSFNPNHQDVTFTCPRTLEMMDKMLRTFGEAVSIDKLPLFLGTLGQGVGNEFFGYCQAYLELPTLAQVVNTPDSIEIPLEPSKAWAMATWLGNVVTTDNIEPIMSIYKRMRIEFQGVGLKIAIKRDMRLFSHPVVRQWSADTAMLMQD